MKMVKGVFLILLFYFIGQIVSHLIDGFVPGSIIGMLLMFACLHFRFLEPEKVKDISLVITKNMSIFFIPAGAGILGSYDLLGQFWSSILIVCSVSTILVIVVVALIQQYMENRKQR